MKRVVLLIVISIISLNADMQVIVKAEKEKSKLQQDRYFLIDQLHGEVSKNQIQIISSSHPTWRWRLGVVGFDNIKSAKNILNIVRPYYSDAYIYDNSKKNSAKKRVVKDEMVEINFTDLSVTEFIKIVSKITNKNIFIPKEMDGNINFVGTKPIKQSKLLALLNLVLLNNGYTLADTKNGYLNIIKSHEAIKSGVPISEESNIEEMQTAVLNFKNLKAIDIMKQAKPLVSKYGKVSSSNNEALVVTDFPKNIKSIRDVIRKLDRNSNTTVKFVTLKNSDAQELMPKVSKMIRSFFHKQAKNQQVQIIANDNSNSLALIGDRDDISQILPFIKRLDSSSQEREKNIELVYVKNTDAQSVAKLLEDLMSNRSFKDNLEQMSQLKAKAIKNKTKGSNIPSVVQSDRKSPQSKDRDDKPSITFDKQLNAVMIFGTKKEREVLKNIITKIDIERQQVFVSVKVIEINNDKASKVGVQYGVVGGVTDSNGLYALSNKMGLSDAAFGANLAKSLDITLPNASKVLALGAAVSLLSENSAANILSQPSILCINNEESSLYVGKTISVISQSSVGSSTTDISRNSYNREDIGLTLKILPRISSDSKVTLNVEISSEDILPGSAIGLPKTTKRVVKTSAIVKDGETIIVGGMVRDKESKTKNGIPIIRNIPLIGKLFSHDDVAFEKTTLVLMLTPYIIEKSEDLTKLRDELGELYALEKEYAQSLIK